MSDLDASKFWLDALKWDENGMIPPSRRMRQAAVW